MRDASRIVSCPQNQRSAHTAVLCRRPGRLVHTFSSQRGPTRSISTCKSMAYGAGNEQPELLPHSGSIAEGNSRRLQNGTRRRRTHETSLTLWGKGFQPSSSRLRQAVGVLSLVSVASTILKNSEFALAIQEQIHCSTTRLFGYSGSETQNKSVPKSSIGLIDKLCVGYERAQSVEFRSQSL